MKRDPMGMSYRLKRPEPKESDVQRAVLHALALHPAVAHAHRMNTGVFRPQRRDGSTGFVRAGFKGCPDVVGMLKGGRALYVEVKRPSGKTTDDQEQFLAQATRDGAVAFVARSADDVYRVLDPYMAAEHQMKGDALD